MTKNTTVLNTPNKQKSLAPGTVILAIISGIMLTASFRPGILSFMAWFAIIPLLKSIENSSHSQALKLGLITGTVHFLTLIYWVIVVLNRYGGLNVFLSTIPYILLCLYLAIYFSAFSLLTNLSKKSRFFVFWIACFWCSLEFVRAKFLTGFPWCLLGYTQYEHLNLIQIADIFGVYGLSFLIVLVNGLTYCLFFRTFGPNKTRKKKADRTFLTWQTVAIGLMVGLTLIYGHYRLLEEERNGEYYEGIKSVVIQGNIDQSIKWDSKFQAQALETYLKRTRTTFDFESDLIVWPETAAPFFFQDNAELSPKVISVAKESESGLVFGSPAYQKIDGTINYYNRAYLISSGVRQLQYYDKVHLVPFGEYVPLKKFLWFVNRLVPAAGDFVAGDEVKPMKHGDLSLGVLICFEAIFPELARAHAEKGAHVLINLTNDAWFGKTSAPYQHLAMAVFRAVENRMPMIRAANTGFSAFIGHQGKIIKHSNLFCEETVMTTLQIPRSPLTFYARYGDLFPMLLSMFALIKIFSFFKQG